MADRSAIEWTDATWNPIRARRLMPDGSYRYGWHCEHASPGCANCYAESFNGWVGTQLPYKPGHRDDVEIYVDEKILVQPLRWKTPRSIFLLSMSDLFASFVTDEMIDRVFAVMALAPQHTLQVLTKRSERMRAWFERYDAAHDHNCADMVADAAAARLGRAGATGADRYDGDGPGWPLPNVWLGTSVEDQQRADERVAHLLATPAAVRFLSCEPLLGPVNLDHLKFIDRETECGGREMAWESALNGLRYDVWAGDDEDPMKPGFPKLDWVICGGESGPRARPMHPDWARDLRDQCATAGVPFFFKQWGEWAPGENASCASTRTERTADWWNDRWDFSSVTVKQSEEMHVDDEPTLWRLGKQAAGRLLDGRLHDAMPTAAPRG